MRTPVRHGALVESWFDMLPDDQQRAMARELRAAVLAAEPRLLPTVKWGSLVFTLSGTNLLAVSMHRSHANFQVFNGAALRVQWPHLEGSGKGMRHLKYRYGQPVDTAQLAALVRDSVAEAQN
jgi:hypothetical protein